MDGRREIFCPEDSLPEDDLVFFLLELIPGLDLSAFHEFYSKDLRGQPPFSVALMTVLLVYSYSVGVFSSRKIALACERNLDVTDKSYPPAWPPQSARNTMCSSGAKVAWALAHISRKITIPRGLKPTLRGLFSETSIWRFWRSWGTTVRTFAPVFS